MKTKTVDVELERCELTRPLSPRSSTLLEATLAATSLTDPNLWPNCLRWSCIMGNVGGISDDASGSAALFFFCFF